MVRKILYFYTVFLSFSNFLDKNSSSYTSPSSKNVDQDFMNQPPPQQIQGQNAPIFEPQQGQHGGQQGDGFKFGMEYSGEQKTSKTYQNYN